MNNDLDQNFVIGIDLGTSSCKTAILSIEGNLLGLGTAVYQAEDIHSKWEEQNPKDLIDGVVVSLRKALEAAYVSPEDCLGLSLGGALHSLLVLDKYDRPLTGVSTWADGRAASQIKRLGKSGDMHLHYMHSGCPNHPMYPMAKIFWLREEHPDLFKEAAWFISAKEYVLLQLSGLHIVDYALAAGSGLLDTRLLTWEEIALETTGIQSSQLSVLKNPNTIIGNLEPAFAAKLGLPRTTPIILGGSDAVNSSLGVGAIRPDQLTCMVGSSGAIRTIANQPILDPQERTWCYVVDPSHWLVGGAINNGGLALQWWQYALGEGSQSEPGKGSPSLDDLLGWASQIEPGANGIICLPFFVNERSPNWNPYARAVFFGLTLQHDRRHIARAILEGIGYRLRSVLDVLDQLVGKVDEIRASGGYVHSPLWLQITADILDRRVIVPQFTESSAIGAAFWALIGLGVVDGIEDLAKYIKVSATYQPNQQNVGTYHRTYETYQELYQLLRGMYEKTAIRV